MTRMVAAAVTFGILWVIPVTLAAQQPAAGDSAARVGPVLSTSMKTDRRLTALERRVAQLEQRLGGSDASGTLAVGNRGSWRRLHRGMPADDVRAALGSPTRINVGLMSKTWWYGGAKGEGWASFDERDRLLSWSEP